MDTKQQHTAEPWEILDEGDVLEINNGTEAVTSDVFDSSKDPKREKVLRDFRRIVACVNACAGIETVQLEVLDIKGAVDGADLARQQRDKLLTALKDVVGAWSGQFERNGHLAPPWAKRARAVIAEIDTATK
jgi:hypothetical protein